MVIVQGGTNLVKHELMHWKKREKCIWLMTVFQRYYKAVSSERWLPEYVVVGTIIIERVDITSWSFFLQVFPFPDVLECCLVLLHIGSQCPPELHEQALDLLRKHSSANIYKKAVRRFLTWHFETKLSPLSCLQLLNTRAVLSSSEGLFWCPLLFWL